MFGDHCMDFPFEFGFSILVIMIMMIDYMNQFLAKVDFPHMCIYEVKPYLLY